MPVVYRRQTEHFYSMPALQQVCGAPSAVWMDSWWTPGASSSGQTTALLFIKSRALSVCDKDATGLSFYKHSFYGGCQAGCEYRGGRTLLLKACPQQWEIFDSHFMPAAPCISSSSAAAFSVLGGQLVSHVLYIPSSMLTVGHLHQLGSTEPVAMGSFPWQPELLQELQCPAVLVGEWLLPSTLFLLEYSCETVWNVNTVA